MVRKWMVGLVAAIAVISVGGVGFAAFTSTVSIQLNATAGSLNIEWIGPSSPAMTGTNTWDKCIASLTAKALTITAGNLAPGDVCTLPASDGVFVTNTGSIPGTLSLYDASRTGGGCTFFEGDNLVPFGGFPTTISPGQELPSGGYTSSLFLPAGDPSSCMGSFVSHTWDLNATAGT